MLTDKAKKVFKKYRKWYFLFLPKHIQWFIIYRWFNVHAKIPIDIQNWIDDGFDYAVTHPYQDKVYVSSDKGEFRTKSFETNIFLALQKANEIYNKTH